MSTPIRTTPTDLLTSHCIPDEGVFVLDLDTPASSPGPSLSGDVDPLFLLSVIPTLSALGDRIQTIEQWESLENIGPPEVVQQMAATLKALVKRAQDCQKTLEAHREEVRRIKCEVKCRSCFLPCKHPFVLPCEHVFCGRCLERVWRPQSKARIESMRLSNGIYAKELINAFEDTEIGFQKVLRIMDRVDPGLVFVFTSYRSPCCHQLIDEPPMQIFALTELCDNPTISNVPQSATAQPRAPNYFFRLFPLPLLNW